jgi:16S rRNA (uracil1498-N3)-methyltransferase
MIPRLYSPEPLAEGLLAPLGPDRAHYRRAVLRREAGAPVALFNDRDGEFAAVIESLSNKGGAARLGARMRPPLRDEALDLLFAPVKRAAVEMIVQKATELGATRLSPVLTRRTNAETVRADRLTAIAVEAAEQCGRLAPPIVAPPRRLADALADWPAGERLLFCDEAGDGSGDGGAAPWGGPNGRAPALIEAVANADARVAGVLIGPEGGFDAEERADLRARPFVIAASLGPRILRADTAAIVALALVNAARITRP